MAKKSSIEALLEVLYKYSTKGFTVRALAKYAGISHTSAAGFVKYLERKSFVKSETFGRAKKVSFNMDSEQAIAEKRMRNIKAAEAIKQAVLEANRNVDVIILFGSFSRGEDIEKSDVDVAVICKGKIKPDFSKIEKYLNRSVNLIVFENFKKIPENLKGSIINGVKLYGVIDA